MLDELEKARCALEEAIKNLHGQLEPALKQEQTSTDGEPCAERERRSEICSRMETHADQLARMCQMVESMTNRLDIPS